MSAEAVTSGVVSGIAKFVFDTLRDRIIKPERARAERDLEVFRTEMRLQTAERESLIRRYPFGEPGRLKNFYMKGARPCLLIAPLCNAGFDAPGFSQDVFDILAQVPSAAESYQAIPDATVSDAAGPRLVRQSDVLEIAAHEFPDQPALLVHFEERVDAVVATASFWRLFPTTTGEKAFSTWFARYNLNARVAAAKRRPPVEPREGILAFTEIELPQSREAAAHVIASTVALFAAAVLDLYWNNRGTESAMFAALSRGARIEEAAQHTQSAFETRLASELDGLTRAGFTPKREALTEGQCRIVVALDSFSVQLDLPQEYPSDPPTVRLIESVSMATQFEFEQGEWTPERNLAQVMGAFAPS